MSVCEEMKRPEVILCPFLLKAQSPISDSGHTADLLMETDGLSSGVYLTHPPSLPPQRLLTPSPHTTWELRSQITQATSTQLLLNLCPSQGWEVIVTEDKGCLVVKSSKMC